MISNLLSTKGLSLSGLWAFALRMEKHNANGEAIAAWLSERDEVSAVHYAGLPSHPQAELFQGQMRHGGSLLSFELKDGKEAACQFIDRLQLVVHVASLGVMGYLKKSDVFFKSFKTFKVHFKSLGRF